SDGRSRRRHPRTWRLPRVVGETKPSKSRVDSSPCQWLRGTEFALGSGRMGCHRLASASIPQMRMPGQQTRSALRSAGSRGAAMSFGTKLTSSMLALMLVTGFGAGCAPKAAAPTPADVNVAALAPPAPPRAADEYRIKAGDELHVRFTYQPEMNEQI